MTELFRKQYHQPGTPPGTLREQDEIEQPGAVFRLATRLDNRWSRMQQMDSGTLVADRETAALRWIDVQGIPTADELARLGEALNLHPLALEDVLNGGQRPKVERFGNTMVVVLGVPVFGDDGTLMVHQLNLFMGRRFVLSIVRDGMDPFPVLRRRLEEYGGVELGEADDLLYGLMDAAVDHVFPVLDTLDERVGVLEEAILERPDQGVLEQLHTLKRELVVLRRHLWPTRDVVNQIMRDNRDLFTEDTLLWMRDVYDHAVQSMDLVESYREMTNSLLDVYLSTMSHKLNETIRRLTVIATIFMPLTFIVGVYGMNFEHPESPWAMPELGWYWGYPMVWLVILTVVACMIWWFRRKHWF